MKTILIGYGGHGFVAADILLSAGITIAGYCDNEEKKINPFNLAYYGTEQDFFSNSQNISSSHVFIAIGNMSLREKVFKYITDKNISIISAIHPSSNIGRHCTLGKSIFIAANATINSCSSIADGVICNTGSSIDHECSIGSFSHICPGTVLCGNVTVGKNCLIGANSTVIPGKKIADNIIVGAGSTIVTDLLHPGIYMGSPARLIRYH